MDITAEKSLGSVQQVSGRLLVKNTDGTERALLVGDVIHSGDVLIAEGGNALLVLSNGRIAEVVAGQELNLGSQVALSGLGLVPDLDGIESIREIEDLPAPAAGNDGDSQPAPNLQSGGFEQGAEAPFGSDEVVVEFGFETTRAQFGQIQTLDNQVEAFSREAPAEETPLTATVTLTVTPDSLTEAGGVITYVVTLSEVSQGETFITTELGTVIIGDGENSGSFEHTVQADEDVYVDGDSVTNTITSASGGNFENLTFSADEVSTSIIDTPDTTTLTLADVTVDEADNGMATIHGRLDYSPQTQLVVTLSNGATITFESSYVAGATVSSTAFPINNDEDVYLDSSSFVVSVSGTNGGGNFESLDTSDTATVTVDDTPNTTTLTLDDVTVDEADNGMATIHGRLDYSPQTQLVVTLSNGATITFESSYVAGAAVSSTAFPINNDEDVYLDSSSFVVSVSGTNGGGNFESLDTSDTATVTVDDTPNTTTLTLDDVTVDEADNGMATIHGRLDYSPQTQLVVTLSNGATITFESSYVAGAAVSSTAFPINNGEDVYLDSSSFVVSVSGTNGGGNFESLDTSDTATVTVDDTANTTTLTLDDVTVDEADNGMATIHGRLDYSPQTQLVVTLSNGATITFESSYVAGAAVSSTAFPINNDEDVYLDSSSFVVSVSGTNGGGNFESLDTSDTATVTVDDTANTTTLTLDDVTVDEADNGMATIHGRLDYSPQTQLVVTLSNGATITFESSGQLHRVPDQQ